MRYNTGVLNQILYRIKRPYHLLKTGLMRGLLAQIMHRFPAKKLKIITITGTDGKTTTSSLTYHLLKTAGKKVGLISTVAAYIGKKQIGTGFHVTSPSPTNLYSFIRQMVNKNFEYLVLEMTAHGTYQYRDWGIKPTVAGLTNITHEHLDYFLTYDQYVAAKALLLKKAQTVILNQDDQSFYRVKKHLKPNQQQIVTYSQQDELDPIIQKAIKTKFKEEYNRMNAKLAAAIVDQVGVESNQIAAGIETFPGVPGRMEEVTTNKKFRVVVDFAHTPNGLEVALQALSQQLATQKKQGRLIAVYGCAGLRDRSKRPLMGKIGVKYADLCVFTAEDPRTENVWSIIRQMKEQITDNHNKIISIADREKALKFTLNQIAQPGDIVGIFGKGPEKSMCIGTTEHPWNDRQVVEKILQL